MESMHLKHKYHNIFLFILIIFLNLTVAAQKEKGFKYYDSASWKQYQDEQWKQLILTSKEAFSNEIDYYYLRMRTGIAYFKKQNYRKALQHFRKAHEFNNSDPVALEYIFYSLLNAGRRDDALLFYYLNKNVLPADLNYEKRFIKSLRLDLAWHQNIEENQRTLFKDINLLGYEGLQIITKNYFFGSFFIEHDLSKRIRLYHGGSFLNKNNFYYTRNTTNAYESYDHTIRQSQYYGALGFNPGGGFDINVATHYVHYFSPDLIYRDRGFGSTFRVPSEEYDYFLMRLSLWKSLGMFKTGIGFSRSNFANAVQYQGDYNIIYYPLGNLNLYFLAGTFLLNEKNTLGKNDLRLAWHGMAGFRISDMLWTEADVYYGDIKNMAMNEAFIVYNGYETLNFKTGLSFIIPVSSVSYSFKLSYLNYTSEFSDSNNLSTGFNDIKTNSFSITGGIKWNF